VIAGRARAACRPEQIGVALLVSPDQLAVRGHHVDRGDLLGRVSSATEAQTYPALEQETAEADGGTVTEAEEATVAR
jgi:hypothetical protein